MSQNSAYIDTATQKYIYYMLLHKMNTTSTFSQYSIIRGKKTEGTHYRGGNSSEVCSLISIQDESSVESYLLQERVDLVTYISFKKD